METLRLILLFLHLLGMAVLFGGWVAQRTQATKQITQPMMNGAYTQLVTGVLLTFVRGDAPDVEQAKIAVKFVVVLVIIGIMHAFRRRDAVPTGPDLAIGLLTILNVGIAVFWT